MSKVEITAFGAGSKTTLFRLALRSVLPAIVIVKTWSVGIYAAICTEDTAGFAISTTFVAAITRWSSLTIPVTE